MKIILLVIGVFATVNTILILYIQSHLYGGATCLTSPCVVQPFALVIYARISIPLSVGSWLAFGLALTLWRQSSSNVMRFSMMRAGFDKSVYDLMVKMRGSGSRLSLLQSLVQSPHHRNELSEMTGIDWKEVDRQIGLLVQYGFVSVDAQAGPVKMYKLTEQGRSLVKLMDEWGKSRSTS